MLRFPVRVDDDLRVIVRHEQVRLTPSEGMRLAEHLIRKSTAAMIREEAEIAERQEARG
jgi:hypothetical protein